MGKFRIIFLGFGLFLIFGSLFYLLNLTRAVKAQEDDVDLHIKLEVSDDGGDSWHNFSGTEFSGGESLPIIPNEQIIIRCKIWNTGEEDARDVNAIGEFDDFGLYIPGLVNTDADGNGRNFALAPGGGISGVISQVDSLSTENCDDENGSECVELSITFFDDLPTEQILINLKGTLGVYTPGGFLANYFNHFAGSAYALGAGRDSTARLVIAEDDDGGSPPDQDINQDNQNNEDNQNILSNLKELPQTGSSFK